jgi:hypothetical protein
MAAKTLFYLYPHNVIDIRIFLMLFVLRWCWHLDSPVTGGCIRTAEQSAYTAYRCIVPVTLA